MPKSAVSRSWAERIVAACVTNIGLKLVSLVIAIVVYVLVRRAAEEAAVVPDDHHAPPACVP